MAFKTLPSQQELRKLFKYSPETGQLFHRKNMRVAGTIGMYGYVILTIKGSKYFAHRVIWKMLNGRDPDGYIDHINQNRSDNRIENLRIATRSDNAKNQKQHATNSSGVTGVQYWSSRNKWRAEIWHKGVKKYLGVFDNMAEAVAARRAAEQEYGYHKNHGGAA